MLSVKVFLFAFLLTAAYADEDFGYDHSYEEDSKEQEKPYHFGYEIEDANGKQHRHEHKDPDGTIRGSYGFVDDHGVHREVHYVADDFGFRAQVVTNEKGTESQHPADVHLHSLYSPHKDVYVNEQEGHRY
ncbi:Cuticle protein 10.9 like protein [Argiope bruennichi]|uniref:Cuticle protein 10.9 like protein n=1 Tax=Argiope bruennichi TaxID=94029 RepID=A0A8T0E7E5_ARGBR|nr:Cuticle protein 10.9 like protein [Argiope bruennichi]